MNIVAPKIDYDFVFDALQKYYEVEEYQNVFEIFSQQSFDEQINDIADALEDALNGGFNV